MNKHTQGPWHNNGADIFQGGKKDRLIAFCGYGATNEIEANACLIAAAPELLKIAKAYMNLLKKFSNNEGDVATFNHIVSTIKEIEG